MNTGSESACGDRQAFPAAAGRQQLKELAIKVGFCLSSKLILERSINRKMTRGARVARLAISSR